MRNNCAKSLQNFRKSGAPRAQKLRALGQRALRILHNVAESSSSQRCIQVRKKSAQRRDRANFAPNSRERIAKSPKNFGAPRAQKLREVGQRCCANLRTSLKLFFESVCVLMHDCARVQRREHTKFAQKSGEVLQNFGKSGTARAQKLHALGQRALHILHNVAES